MKFARTIRLDISDTQVFPMAAEPEEWAVTGTFAFAASDPADWSRKEQLAFRSGWLGTASFGRATFVQVAVLPDTQMEELVRRLAGHLYQQFGAPDMLAASEAARAEIADMATLCDHPAGTLLGMERDLGDDGITERVRVVPRPDEPDHARIWTLEPDD